MKMEDRDQEIEFWLFVETWRLTYRICNFCQKGIFHTFIFLLILMMKFIRYTIQYTILSVGMRKRIFLTSTLISALTYGFWCCDIVMACSPRYMLKQDVSKVVRSVNKQLREKSIKTKVEFYLVWSFDDQLRAHTSDHIVHVYRLVPSRSWKNW